MNVNEEVEKDVKASEPDMRVSEGERWGRLILGSVVLLFVGIIYVWAILRIPLATEFGWDSGQLSWNYTITIIAFSLGGFCAGLVAKKVSIQLRLIIAAVLLFGGFFIASQMGDNLFLLYLSYGIMAGAGVGIVYLTVIGATNAWFPDRRGLASGILMMSFALTTLIIGNVADLMIKAESIGWRSTYVALAIAEAAIVLIAAFVVKMPKPGTVFPTPKAVAKAQAADKTAGQAPAQDYTSAEMVKRASFWKLFVFCALLAAVGSAAIALVGQIFTELGLGAASLATVIGIVALFNGFGRLASGWLFDNVGIRTTQYITSAIAIAGPATVVLALVTNNLVIGIIGVSLCYFSYGFAPTTSSVFASSFYGMKNFSQNFSMLNLFLIPAPFAATMGGLLFVSTNSFVVPFAILAGAQVIGLFINLTIRKA
ncbi:MAG: MFS transporter [Propionibacteriaceae bacterium]|nr:MFS transporter [Propionibacteriaceae bacterium]